MDLDVATLTDAALFDEITIWAGRVAAGEAVLLRLVGELDERGTWAQHGALSCAHWLSWRCSWSLATAQDRVRVARALRVLPLVTEQLGQGRLSYSQVRAIVRVAAPGDEQRWVELARHCTAAQLEKAARGVQRSRRNEERATAPDQTAHPDATRVSWDDDGCLLLTVRIEAEHAPAVLAVLEQVQREEQAERDVRLQELAVELAAAPFAGTGPEAAGQVGVAAKGGAAVGTLSAESPGDVVEEPPAWVFEDPTYPDLDFAGTPTAQEREAIDAYWQERRRRQAWRDAWRAEQERLAAQVTAEAAARQLPTGRATLADALVRVLTRPRGGAAVKVQLLIDPVSGWARTGSGELLPPSTLKTILKTLPGRGQPDRVRPLTAADLSRHDRGRDSRDVAAALRALLGQLDGERCRFPGCSRVRNLHAHHVVYWSHGGPTDLANLVLVCARHHTLIHDHGFRLELSADRSLRVHTSDGTGLLHHPAPPTGWAQDLPGGITAGTLPTDWTGERMDLGYVVNVLTQHAA